MNQVCSTEISASKQNDSVTVGVHEADEGGCLSLRLSDGMLEDSLTYGF